MLLKGELTVSKMIQFVFLVAENEGKGITLVVSCELETERPWAATASYAAGFPPPRLSHMAALVWSGSETWSVNPHGRHLSQLGQNLYQHSKNSNLSKGPPQCLEKALSSCK